MKMFKIIVWTIVMALPLSAVSASELKLEEVVLSSCGEEDILYIAKVSEIHEDGTVRLSYENRQKNDECGGARVHGSYQGDLNEELFKHRFTTGARAGEEPFVVMPFIEVPYGEEFQIADKTYKVGQRVLRGTLEDARNEKIVSASANGLVSIRFEDSGDNYVRGVKTSYLSHRRWKDAPIILQDFIQIDAPTMTYDGVEYRKDEKVRAVNPESGEVETNSIIRMAEGGWICVDSGDSEFDEFNDEMGFTSIFKMYCDRYIHVSLVTKVQE